MKTRAMDLLYADARVCASEPIISEGLIPSKTSSGYGSLLGLPAFWFRESVSSCIISEGLIPYKRSSGYGRLLGLPAFWFRESASS